MELIKGSESYNLIITEELQKKIDYLCQNIHNVEWSGTLFYKIKGEFNDQGENKLTVTAIDLCLQDIGSSTYTEFSFSPTLAHYICTHDELLDDGVFQGLIHSHNNMSTFFSGTDISTLRKEGNEKDNFVSLIVNNHRKYTAGITSKCTKRKKLNQISFYKTFFDKIIEKEELVETEETIVEWYDLNVHIPEEMIYTELDEAIAEIKKEKEVKAKEKANITRVNTTPGKYIPFMNDSATTPYFSNNYKSHTGISKNDDRQLPFVWENTEEDDEVTIEDIGKYIDQDSDVDIVTYYENIKIDYNEIDKIIRQLLTGSVLTAEHDKLDLNNFVKTSTTLFNKRFTAEKDFINWAQYYIDFLLSQTPVNEKEDDEIGAYAYHIINRLGELPESRYMDLFIDILTDYI